MKLSEKEYFAQNRPLGSHSVLDKGLIEAARDFRRQLQKGIHQLELGYFGDDHVARLALLLVEFGEDIHADLGLWRALESLQEKLHGTPLPFVVRPGEEPGLTPFDARRIRYLLWTLLPVFDDDIELSPSDPDLIKLAEMVSRFLTDKFAKLPATSSLTPFLQTPDLHAWDVKRKLLWLARSSYLFRGMYVRFITESSENGDVMSNGEDFMHQECTPWSGLGALDLIAEILRLPEKDSHDVRHWYERHTAFYRIEKICGNASRAETLTARNLINGKDYIIRMDDIQNPFSAGMVVFGSLVPWRGEWYWAGAQRMLQPRTEAELGTLRESMFKSSAPIAFRYCPAELEKARGIARDYHGQFVAHYGNDLVVFPDGNAYAASEKARMLRQRELMNAPAELPELSFNLPSHILKHQGGIALFSYPEEGCESFMFFEHLLSGLRKKGHRMNEGEIESVRNFMEEADISPSFVHRVVREHGPESILSLYGLSDVPPAAALEMILRRHKGHFYRKRYPALSLVNV